MSLPFCEEMTQKYAFLSGGVTRNWLGCVGGARSGHTSKVLPKYLYLYLFSCAWIDLIQDVVKVQKNESKWKTKNWLSNKYYFMKYHSLNKISLQPRQPALHTQAAAPLSCEQNFQTIQRSVIFVPWSVKCTLYKIFGYSLSYRRSIQKPSNNNE